MELAVFAEGFVRLHHESAAADLAQNPHLLAFGVQHQHLGVMGHIHAFKLAPLRRRVVFFFYRFGHWTFSLNALTGSISTGTSWTFANADFSSAGMDSYFLNHCSARPLSPVASISSSSFANAALAGGILA